MVLRLVADHAEDVTEKRDSRLEEGRLAWVKTGGEETEDEKGEDRRDCDGGGHRLDIVKRVQGGPWERLCAVEDHCNGCVSRLGMRS